MSKTVIAHRNFLGKVTTENRTVKVDGEDRKVTVVTSRQTFEKGKLYEIDDSDYEKFKQYGLTLATDDEIAAAKAAAEESADDAEGGKKSKK